MLYGINWKFGEKSKPLRKKYSRKKSRKEASNKFF